jgi:hypothetical protein
MTCLSVEARAALRTGGDLHGVVAVIVEDQRAVPLAGPGEAPFDAAEAGQRLPDLRGGHTELAGDRNGGGGVQRVVPARHGQDEIVDLLGHRAGAVAELHLEAALATGEVDVEDAHVGLRILAIGDDAAVGDGADHVLHDGMVDAHDAETVEGAGSR